MTLNEAIVARHSVRKFKDISIETETQHLLDHFVEECNIESGLNMKVYYDDPNGFDSRLVHYGAFENVNNYIVIKGKDCENFAEKCGYYGEKVVLQTQMLGLNTCWTALTYNKKLVKTMVPKDEKLCMTIALGYGQTQGVPHKSKPMDKLVATKGEMPEWFRKGAEAALLAPTAVNQQKFKMGIIHGEPAIKVSGVGVYTNVDLGIVKCHFEIGSGRKVK